MERLLKGVVRRVFMVYYAGLYLNLTKDYYEKLYDWIKKIGNLDNKRKYIEASDYQKVCRIPILALAIDKNFESIMLRKFDDVLPVVKYSTEGKNIFEILSPDVTATSYDRIIDFFNKLPSLIAKHFDISIKMVALDNKDLSEEITDIYGHEIMYILLQSAKKERKATDIAYDIELLMSGINPYKLYELDSLRRE